jgi:hypothetical protein
MIGIYISVAVALMAAGAITAILTVFAAGIHREEKARSLTSGSPGRVASGIRAVHGVYSRGLRASP